MTLTRKCPSPLGASIGLLLCLSQAPAWGSEASDRAAAALALGDLRAAMIELKGALQKDPNDADARLMLARLHLQSGNGLAAEKEILTAIELNADSRLWRLDLVKALILQARFDEALERLEGAGDLSGADAERVLVLRGDAALGQGKTDEAAGFYNQAVEANADNQEAAVGLLRVALKNADTAATIKATDDFLKRFPDNVEALLIRAELHRAAGEHEAAIKVFDRVIAADQRNVVARLGRATALIGVRNLEDARKALAEVDQIQPNIPMTSYLRGVLDFQEKNWPEAAQQLELVLSAVPDHLQSQLLLGIIRYSEGEMETADELLSKVISATPGNVQARKVLAAARIKMREPDRAIEALQPLSAEGDPQTLALLGSAYMLQGDLEKGQELLNRAVEDAPNVAALRTQLALTLLASGQTGKAVDELQSAVDLGQDILQADVLLVLAHLKGKEFDKALEASQRLEERRGESPIPFNLTGLALMAKGDFPAARERFEKALAVNPEFVTAEINLARIDVAAKDYDAAQRRYERVLETNAKHLGALLGLAALAEMRKDPDALVSALERAQDANPTATQPGLLLTRFYIIRGDYLKALAVANDLAGRFPEEEPVLQMLARAQTLGGEVPNAIRSFDQLLKVNPNDPQLSYLAGGARWKAQDHSGAQAAFRRALELKPDFVDAQVALASVSLDAGDTDSAKAAAKALQKDFPDAAVGYRVEGSIHNAQRNHADAATAFQNAFSREPSSVLARQYAEALNQSGAAPKAVKVLESWVEKNPKDLESKSMLGLFLQQVGRPKEAIALYEGVVEQSPERNPLLLNNLAWLYHKENDPRGEAIAREAYELAPGRPEIADTYGWILYLAGKREEGLGILQQAYLAFPTQTEIGLHVATALEGLGRNPEAIQILQKLLRENPSSPQTADATALLKKLGG